MSDRPWDRLARRTLPCALALALVAPAAGCGDADEPANGAAARVTLATIPTDTSAQGFYAQHHGDFERERLDVRLVIQADPTQLAAAVQSGDAQFALTSAAGVALLEARGAKVAMVASGAVYDPGAPTTALVAGRRARVRSVADLAGRRVAIDALNSLPHLALVEALRRSGISPGRVRFVEIPFAQMLQPLARGNVDAAVLPEPFLTIGLSQGARRVENVFDAVCSRTCLLTAWIAQERWAAENRETVARFRRAIESASAWANEPENRRSSGAMLRRYAPIDERVLSRMTRAAFAERLEPRLAQPWIDALARNRAIPERFDAVELTR